MCKHINHWLAMLVVVALLLTTAAMPAFAADSEDGYVTDPNVAAEKLYELGLMSGQGTNPDGTPDFALDKSLTRIEAITMLVNLISQDGDAELYAKNYPFEDVPDWAEHIVAYAYENNLTSGTSETTFGSKTPMTATQYLSFLLKALGYVSGADFAWNEAAALSDRIGITRGEFTGDEQMTRGDLAVFSCNALNVMSKDGSGTMLEHIQAHVEFTIADGVLRISGKGPMPNYSANTSKPWAAEINRLMNELMKEGRIDEAATVAKTVIVEEGITSVGDYAFSGLRCVDIQLPEGIRSIGKYAFSDCGSLHEVNIPSTVKSIGESAFLWCRQLAQVTLPEGIERIEAHTFDNMSLREIELPKSLTYIGDYAFAECGITSLTIPASVTYISNTAFYTTECLTSFTVDSANSVYESADNGPMLFTKDGDLVAYPSATGDIVIPDGVKRINMIFQNDFAPVTSITLPASLTWIAPTALGNTSITDIYFGGTEEQWAAIAKDLQGLDSATVHCNSTGK